MTEVEIKEQEEIVLVETSCLLACNSIPYYELDTLLRDLHTCRGSGFINQLKLIAGHSSFTSIQDEINIYSAGGENSDDYPNLLNAARKAVEHGYKVFILPNPKGFRTPDFIFEQKGNYKLYDLKTITGKSSVSNRLVESIGQSNRVLLNMAVDYNTRLLVADIKKYFEINTNAIEVLIFKGKKAVSIDRHIALHPAFYRLLKKRYEK